MKRRDFIKAAAVVAIAGPSLPAVTVAAPGPKIPLDVVHWLIRSPGDRFLTAPVGWFIRWIAVDGSYHQANGTIKLEKGVIYQCHPAPTWCMSTVGDPENFDV